MTANNSNPISFKTVARTERKVETEKRVVPVDPRNWVAKMFLNFDPTDNTTSGLEVITHDCHDEPNLGQINYEPNSITLLLDFGTGVDGCSHSLRGEDVIVLGGNRSGKAGQGRLWVPVSQFRQFLANSQSLLDYLEAEIPKLKAEVAEARKAKE